MKKLNITFLLICLSFTFTSTAVDYRNLFSNQTTVKENYVLVEDAGLKKIIIPFHFNQSTTSFNKLLLKRVSPKRVRSITYIYNKNNNISHQSKLNNARIDSLSNMFGKKLKHVNGDLFSTIVLSNDHIDKSQFTGFVITVERSSKENLELMNLMMSLEAEKIDENSFTLDTLPEYGYILPHFKQNLKKSEYGIVSNVFRRNSDWKSKLIIVDVTGSMTPYLSQYLLWLKLTFNRNEEQNYVFFNDGNDNKRRGVKKTIGATGGLYFAQNRSGYKLIETTMKMAMKNGGGGDCPENNLEAVIAGENKYKNAKEIIMIADNHATPRDMELIKDLDRPVRIILCGIRNQNINAAYLNLAFKTGGSVHTIESDLKTLKEKKEGDRFNFNGKWYIIKGGEVVLETRA